MDGCRRADRSRGGRSGPVSWGGGTRRYCFKGRPGVAGPRAHLAWAHSATLSRVPAARECSRRALSSPILVVRSLLLGS